MIVYNIRKAQYARQLTASGIANRWNKDDEYVIYAGSSISLSILEMVAHRNTILSHERYKLLYIEVDVTQKDIKSIGIKELPGAWRSLQQFPTLQHIGSERYHDNKKLLLEVPSVHVPEEHNYLINSLHPDFIKKVKLVRAVPFSWDKRLL